MKLWKTLVTKKPKQPRLCYWNVKNGPKYIKMERQYDDMILKCANFTKYLYSETPTSRTTETKIMEVLADTMHFHVEVNQLKCLVPELNLLDPVGDGDCGFMALQLFGMFLLRGNEAVKDEIRFREAVLDTMSMRKYVVEKLTSNHDYYKKSLYQKKLTYIPQLGTIEAFDKEFLKKTEKERATYNMWTELHEMDMEPTARHGLYGIIKKENKEDGEKRPNEMDVRHCHIFAKETGTRVILVTFIDEKNSYLSFEMDFRETKEDCYVERGVQRFTKDFDFYRTLVLLNSLTCKEIDTKKDEIVPNASNKHFSMWIPENYDCLLYTSPSPRDV
jgi:hypothetical protein